jgi:hypothetical protein
MPDSLKRVSRIGLPGINFDFRIQYRVLKLPKPDKKLPKNANIVNRHDV